jgi:drug/metabolite transporter (DMT)-like permease
MFTPCPVWLRLPVRAGVGQLAHRVTVPTERQFAPASLWIKITVLSLIKTGIAYVLNYQIITSEGATIASTVTYLLPVVAIVLGVLVLGENITAMVIGGIALVLAGVALTRRGVASSGH